MSRHRVREEELQKVRIGSRYIGLELGQFYWECLKLAAASEELTETDILRRITKSWSETLPPTTQEKARAETTRVEAWKAQVLRAREDARLQAKQAKLNTRRARLRGKGPPKVSRTVSPASKNKFNK
jgi:hypothetical protein